MSVNLRKKAEKLLEQNPLETPLVDTVFAQRLVQDLQVQQIELEKQNKELRRVQVELGAARDAYMELYDFAPLGYLILDAEGWVMDANFTAATLLGVEPEKLLDRSNFSSFVHREALENWNIYRLHLAEISGKRGVDLRLKNSGGKELTVRVECTLRSATGQCLMALTDISERVRAEQAVKKSEQDLLLLNQQLEQLVDQRSAELLESEERFRVLFEEAPDACFLMGLDGRYIYGNKAVEVLTGYRREELLGRNMLESQHYPTGTKAQVMERFGQLERLGQGEKLDPLEYNLLRKDGTEFTAEISTIPIVLHGKTVSLSTARDLTQRKKAEAERASLDRQCRIALNAANMGWWHYDVESGVVSYDQPFGEIYGAPEGKWHVEDLLKAMNPDDSSRVLASVEAVMESLSPQSYVLEYRVLQPGGSLRWVEAHALGEFEGKGDARRLTGLSGTVADISERKQSEEALRASETRFRSTVNNLLVGVVVHAPDSTVLLSNPQASLLLGLSAKQMQGKQALHPDWHFVYEDRSVVKFEDYPVRRVVATGERFVYECMGIQKPGCADITWVTGSAIPVFTQENVLDQIIVNFMDVTEIKRLQQALQKRVLALTHPLDQPEGIAFEELFNVSEMQRIQDEFSAATGVASIITDSEGAPITEPSNFVEHFQNTVSSTEEVCADVFSSLSEIRRHHPEGPIIRQCSSSGLWDAGTSIAIGDRHVATWLIGQVRENSLAEEQMRAYARDIGADEMAVIGAFCRVPVMTREHFEGIAQALFMLATQLSTSAYQNVQQARFIEGQKRAEQALQEGEEKYRKLFESESDAILIFDGETRQFIDINDAALELYGYTREEFMWLTHNAITADPEMAEVIFPRVRAGTHVSTYQSLHRKKDSTVFPVEITPLSYYLRGRQVFCGVIRDVTERVAYESEREKNHEELRKLASELSLAEQRERERIGRELHDGISQLLSSSLLRLQMLKDSPVSGVSVESLETVCGIIKRALGETRSLTFELSYPMLEDLGLAAALEELCSSMSHDYAIHFEFKGAMVRLPISMDRKIVIYRSTRELLINVMKHSGVQRACVHLEQAEDAVRVRVEDDGTGFDAQMAGEGFSPTGGFGLFSIRESIRHAGGSLLIESSPGGGTDAVVSVPLEVSYE